MLETLSVALGYEQRARARSSKPCSQSSAARTLTALEFASLREGGLAHRVNKVTLFKPDAGSELIRRRSLKRGSLNGNGS